MELKQRLASYRGQSLVEFALIMPFILLVAFGVIEVSYALLDQHVATKLTREGSNLISRDVSINDAVNALRNMSTRPVDFNSGRSRIIFTVLRRGTTPGTPNYNNVIAYQRYAFGGLTGVQSALPTAGSGAYNGSPDYQAVNADSDTRLQISTLPGNLTIALNGSLYVTEIFTRHDLITPLSGFGVTVPSTLYSIAYF
ncbi:MAG TPA: TadE family protein [Vicinamibacterales bacterium]|nr:TadE family protein [Vicinamibacterales bacterium]